MNSDFDNGRALYVQVEEILEKQIINGKLKPNTKIPAIRELSLKYQVNPNTVQKALNDLEDKGLIYTKRTNGKFVTDDLKLINKTKEFLANKILQKFLQSMEDIGFTKNDIIKILEKGEK